MSQVSLLLAAVPALLRGGVEGSPAMTNGWLLQSQRGYSHMLNSFTCRAAPFWQWTAGSIVVARDHENPIS